MNNNLLILGAGSHGYVVREIAMAMGIFDKISFLDDNVINEDVVGSCLDYIKFIGEYTFAIPSFGNNQIRMEWIQKLEADSFVIPALIHPSAFVSPTVTVESGCIISPMAMIHTNSRLEKGCILSLGAVIDHDVFIGSGSRIDCGAVVQSFCAIESGTTINSGVTIARINRRLVDGFFR